MIIKVCGMRDSDNIRQIEKLGIDIIGFIFYSKSPRYISERPAYLPENIRKAGVFVNENLHSIQEKIKLFHLDYVQLHGEEPPELCQTLQKSGVKIIKAFPIGNTDDLKPCISYYTCCDFLLFDTRTSTGRGGSGKTFPWEILDNYHGPVPFLLSGGIAPEDFIKIKRFFHPKFTGIDLNSRFEIEPGLKDAEKLKRFIDHIKFTDRNEQD